jgi:hypothetical protein
MLLDIQYYSPKDPQPYDDTGWTLGPLFNVRTVRLTDTKVLEAKMTLLTKDAAVEGKIVNVKKGQAAAFVVNHTAEPELMTFRYRLKDVKMMVAEDGFTEAGLKFNVGAFIIPREGNPADLEELLGRACRDLGLMAYGLAALPSSRTHDLDAPRIAILHSWVNTQDEGWFRLAFDKLGIPYAYVSLQDVRDDADLRAKYDVILFPPSGFFGKAQRLVNGIGGKEPIPWKKSDKYPNFGGPDTRDDIRGGLELEGIVHLKSFIEQGGLFVPIANTAELPISYGIVESVAVVRPPNFRVSGSVLSANISDLLSPIGYGYDRNMSVYFSGGPVLETGVKAVTGSEIEDLFGGASKDRPSGRGSVKDPDIIQGRIQRVDKVQGAGPGIPEEYKDLFDLYMPADLKTIRVVMRFDTIDKLLVSGLLEGGEALATKPAVVDVPVGKGHVVFFAINPMWRQQTFGSFFLLFNAMLNYRSLDAGRPAAAPAGK